MIDSIDRHAKHFPKKTKNYSSTRKYMPAKPHLMWTLRILKYIEAFIEHIFQF